MKRIFLLLIFTLGVFTLSCSSQNIKRCEFAGSWYPADPEELRENLRRFMQGVRVADTEGKILGIISPHAGHIYSGPVAAYGYKAVAGRKFDTVILIGPSHHYSFSGAAVFGGRAFETPLGNLEIDSETTRELLSLPFFASEASYFSGEHNLEVQLPFVIESLGPVKIVPVLLGQVSYAQIELLGRKLADLLRHKKILVIASTDLSHFHTYREAVGIDRDTISLIKKYDAQKLWQSRDFGGGRACGIAAIAVFLNYVNDCGAELKVLNYANSGDTTGDKTKVVGYLSAAAYRKDEVAAKQGGAMEEYTLSAQEKETLLKIARQTLTNFLNKEKIPKFSVDSDNLRAKRGAFVTLKKNGQLRGCIGRIVADLPLYEVISRQAVAAAVHDPRFPPVTAAELADIDIEISVLTPFTEVKSLDEIEVGRHGLMIRKGFYSGILLPQVPVEWGWDRDTFLEQTAQKAGLPRDAYKDNDATLYRFSAIVFGEKE